MKTKTKKPGRIKAAVLNWLGFSLDSWAHWDALFGASSKAGVTVTPDKALTISAVWACTRLIAQTISTLPLGFYERLPDGSRRLVDDMQIARLLHTEPSDGVSAVVFWESIVSNAIIHGNGFGEKKYIGERLVAIEYLNTDRLSWRSLENGDLEFRYRDDRGNVREIPEENIFHIPGFTMSGRFGMSVIKYGAEVFGAAIASNDAASSSFKNGLQPTTYFKIDRVLTKDQRKEFRDSLSSIKGALNSGKSPLLEGGMDTGTIGINPNDAQLLESRVFSVEEVCRWFGVPPSMIGATDKASSWASSSESLNLWFLQYALRPWLRRIQQAIQIDLLSPAERKRYYAEFEVDGLLQANTEARKELFSSALQNGWMSRNEVRKLQNLPPIEGGDIHTVQTSLIPIDKLGSEDNAGNALKAALRTFLSEESQ